MESSLMFGDTKAGWIANGFRVQQAFTKRAGYEAARVTLPRRRNIHADHSHYFAIGVRIWWLPPGSRPRLLRRRWHQPDHSNRDHSVAVEGYLKSALIPQGRQEKTVIFPRTPPG